MSDWLRISGLRAGYGATVVLEDIEFSLPERGTLAVLGRNGVGKTTLLATLMGHTTQHAGTIELRGQSISKLPPYDRSRIGIGYVPQTRDIFPSLSTEENLTVAGRPGRWTLERVYDLFPRLKERRANMGNQLSGGEQQMLSIGRALMGNPTLMLMDEPLEGLAPIIVEELLGAIRRVAREEGLSSIVVEQHPQLVLAVTDEAIVLERGTIAHRSRSEVLAADPSLLDPWLGVASH